MTFTEDGVADRVSRRSHEIRGQQVCTKALAYCMDLKRIGYRYFPLHTLFWKGKVLEKLNKFTGFFL